ncbi:MAG: hypothetical protein EXQ97_00880 [Alphaproteobacteria bacterium]|nr:hypothetical protein [Alphaproteobacteria bacterium]
MTAWDGREAAPSAAVPNLFLATDGKPLDFATAAASGRAVGVPGVLRLLGAAQSRHGRLPLATLFARAEALAHDGFPVSPRLAGQLAGGAAARLRGRKDSEAIWFPGGVALAAGERLAIPAPADTFARLAAHGPAPFYGGPVAATVVAAVGWARHAVIHRITLRTAPSAMRQGRRDRRRCCCATAPATTIACIRTCTASTPYRCRRLCCWRRPATIPAAARSCWSNSGRGASRAPSLCRWRAATASSWPCATGRYRAPAASTGHRCGTASAVCSMARALP